MKYIISENRLQEFVNSYLDNILDQSVVMRPDPYIIIAEPSVDDFPYSDWMEYDRLDGRLWINRKFLQRFMDTFGFDAEMSQELIGNWFEGKFDRVIKYKES